jgi:tRNA 2-thiouridine synthesizing protein A
MNQDELKNLKADKVVDGVMEVLSSDEGTNNDIPLWAKKMQYEFLGVVEDAGFWRLFVKRSK